MLNIKDIIQIKHKYHIKKYYNTVEMTGNNSNSTKWSQSQHTSKLHVTVRLAQEHGMGFHGHSSPSTMESEGYSGVSHITTGQHTKKL